MPDALFELTIAQQSTAIPDAGGWTHWFWWLAALAGSVAALVYAHRFYRSMVEADCGDENMIRIAGYVTAGAQAYLRQQYKVVAVFFVVISLVLAGLAWGLEAQSKWVPFAFMTGGFFSGLSGFIGMRTATSASNRTAAAARVTLNQALQVSFRSGAVMGLVVVGLGLLDICLWFLVLYALVPAIMPEAAMSLEQITVTMLCFGMGASTQALFARVGGGIFTKAADVGADLVGKVEAGIPEDDPRNPATIADNVGDNVGDVAGMGADLYESYCGSILASAALGVAAFAADGLKLQLASLLLPMALAGVGIALSILGIYWVRTEETADQATLLRALARGINLSTGLIVIAAFVLVLLMLGADYLGVSVSVVVGLAAGWIIGKWTEYSTSDVFQPTRDISDQAQFGPATVIIAGIAQGMHSTWLPALTVCIGTLASYVTPIITAHGWSAIDDPEYISLGLYGIGVAAVGMLSTLGITLATDAYGPIADNAGGNAEMTHQEPVVRQRTDALDSLGNTTAATGKGFAIGSAALTALALLAAYLEEVRVGYVRWGDSVDVPTGAEVQLVQPSTGRATRVWVSANDGTSATKNTTLIRIPGRADKLVEKANMRDLVDLLDINPMNPRFLVGVLAGSMLVFTFAALTMKAVGRAAGNMVAEVRRQFKEIPGIMEGKAEPDYAVCVQISTKAAQKEMVLPSMVGLLGPVVGGLLLGVAGVIGILTGAMATGFTTAVFMANAGGAWDNAKKFIERGAHGGKGSVAHKAGVVGDTVGDPFKDTSGPSINILIKLMSMVSVVFAGAVIKYSL
jgi:inorganic pyrophosphatase/K(+)-stimulated pyrophosphate-energized sodium pump